MTGLPGCRRLPAANRAGLAATLAGVLLGLFTALQVILTGESIRCALPLSLPGASFSLLIDPLAAFFLVPVFLISGVNAVYGKAYMPSAASGRSFPDNFFFNLLILSMALVICAANGLLFLFAWECMSLTSFFLVIVNHREAQVRQAGLVYIVAAHMGAAFLFAFFILAGLRAGSLDFAAFTVLRSLAPLPAAGLFLLALAGFGGKAGLFPLHIWLPEAHPAAPSHVSSLMSAVLVKTALYGLLRTLTFLPPPPAWWGGVILTLGAAGAVFGIAMAAAQNDLKRLLAYSTVENIGLIFLALGFWMFARATHHDLAAALALAGGLIHIWNHSLFKGLLFLGAGSLVHATQTRNLDRMGGLLPRMPVTGLLLITGAMAISALPPFNGLIGEWYIYRGLLEGGLKFEGLAALIPIILAGFMALTGAMVLLAMVRIVGIGLSGEPRSRQAEAAHEPARSMSWSMAVLSLLCLAGGLLPVLLVKPALLAAELLAPGSAAFVLSDGNFPARIGAVNAGIIVMLGIVLAIRRRFFARPKKTVATWGCGFLFPTPRMSYSAEGFSELAVNSFYCGWMRPAIHADTPRTILPGPAFFTHKAGDFFLHSFYLPLFQAVSRFCYRMRRLQSGSLHIYIFYIFCTLTLLLAVLTFD